MLVFFLPIYLTFNKIKRSCALFMGLLCVRALMFDSSTIFFYCAWSKSKYFYYILSGTF